RLDYFIQTLANVVRVENLPYHTMGKYKWETLCLKYPLEGIEPPTKERVEYATRLLHSEEYTTYLRRLVASVRR
ncbi:pyruvate formate lyase 1-activating protein, partial [Enterococcus faecium]